MRQVVCTASRFFAIALCLSASSVVAGCESSGSVRTATIRPGGGFRSDPASTDRLSSIEIGRADLMVSPWLLGATSDLIIVSDVNVPHLHVMDAATGRHIKSFGTGGDGPDAFGTAPYLMRATLEGRADSVRFLDGRNRRLVAIGLNRLRSSTLKPEFSIVRIDTLTPVFADGPDRTGRVLGIQTRFPGGSAPIWLDPTTGIGGKGPWRRFPRTDIDSSSLADAYSGRVCYSRHFDALLQPFFWAGRIDVVTSDGSSGGAIEAPFPFEPHVEPDPRRGGRMLFYGDRGDVRQGYLDCAVTEMGHYGLYDGRRVGDGPPDRRLDSELHFFDRNGRFVRAYLLDHHALMMAVPDGDSLLFTVSEADSGYVVRRTRLPYP